MKGARAMPDRDELQSRAGRARRRADDPVEVQPDPFVAELLKRAKPDTGLATVVGIPGDSTRGDAYSRIYLRLQLDEYVDIRKEDIVAARPMPNASSPLGCIAIWMPADADVYYTRVGAQSSQASFLQGAIARAHAPQPGEGGLPPVGGPPQGTLDINCSTLSQGCVHICIPVNRGR